MNKGHEQDAVYRS